MARVFAISDVHVDYQGNMQRLLALSDTAYRADALLLAGDVSDNLARCEELFTALASKFAQVVYVPGNHDLWVRLKDCQDSFEKLHRLQQLCHQAGVATAPVRFSGAGQAVWLVPLYSWYVKHDEGDESLYRAKAGEDKSLSMWSDNYHVKWPDHTGRSINRWLLGQNDVWLDYPYDAPVVTMSHFLPQQALIFPPQWQIDTMFKNYVDPYPEFNFTSVAGSTELSDQIEQIGAAVHVYGHQHRNRYRTVKDTLYVSNCLGYPRENPYDPLSGHYHDDILFQVWDLAANAHRPTAAAAIIEN